MKDRIKKARKINNLTMEQFGKRIGITKSSVSLLESGKNSPSEQTIKLICREFNINYLWLTQGIEPMEQENDCSTLNYIGALMTGENKVAKNTIKVLSRLDEKQWETLANIIKEISNEL